jgi:putative ubiquitin-RnfH superfamily antitoxin RatB of RatAB toxin-antitoxin module
MSTGTVAVAVAYARPDRQWWLPLTLPAGSTALDAVRASGLLDQCPELVAATLDLGLYARPCPPDTVLVDGDRVDIYRPLTADPKEVRRQRAAEGKTMRKGGAATTRGGS